MLQVSFRRVAVLVSLSSFGCVSAEKEQASASLPVSSTAVTAVDWQQVLHDDVVQLENAGNQFLEASFNLYDLLLEDSATLSPAVHSSLKEAAIKYDALAKSAAKLAQDLDNPAIKGELPLSHSQGEAEYAALRALVEKFPARRSAVVPYDGNGEVSVSQIVFGRDQGENRAELRDIPPAHRDALQLLDLLRDASNQLAQATLTVSDWVNTAQSGTSAMTHH